MGTINHDMITSKPQKSQNHASIILIRGLNFKSSRLKFLLWPKTRCLVLVCTQKPKKDISNLIEVLNKRLLPCVPTLWAFRNNDLDIEKCELRRESYAIHTNKYRVSLL